MMNKGGVGGDKGFLPRSGLGFFLVLLITEVCVVDVVGVFGLGWWVWVKKEVNAITGQINPS